jgi:polyhydroxyalkanoate synthase
VGDDHPPDPNEWLRLARKEQGSWWTDWAAWTIERSGETRKARRSLGNRSHKPLGDAPGRYVHQR